MSLNRMWRRYDRLLGPDVASDVDQELRFHIEAKVEDLVAQGWNEDQARKEAERQFGNLCILQREGERIGNGIERRRRMRDYWSDVLQDTRYGFRKVVKSPGFALFVILTLAVGIGLCSVIWAFLRATLGPLPAVPEPERLVMMQAPATSVEIAAISRELAAIDPRITMFNMQTLPEYLAEQDRLTSMISAIYTPVGVFGLILACLGLAGVTAQTVQRRQKEIGIRIALGARRIHALRLVMGEGVAMVLSGAVLGFLVASGLARVLAAISAPMAQVIGPAASDPGLTVGVPSLFVLLAAIACYIPARHSAGTTPLVALREE